MFETTGVLAWQQITKMYSVLIVVDFMSQIGHAEGNVKCLVRTRTTSLISMAIFFLRM